MTHTGQYLSFKAITTYLYDTVIAVDNYMLEYLLHRYETSQALQIEKLASANLTFITVYNYYLKLG